MALNLQDGTDLLLQDGTILLLQAEEALLVVSDPDDVSVSVGDNASFFAYATGTGTVTYQWYEATIGLLTGETGTSLTIWGALANNGNQYYYIATDDNETAQSASATMSVVEATLEPQVRMDRSRDGGRTFTDERWRSMGKIGEYNRRLIWRRNGRAHTTDMYRFTISDKVQVVGIQLTMEVK
jgi:hypothetical protein